MNNFDKLSLEYEKSVNNTNQEKLISNIKHNISKEEYEYRLSNYVFDSEYYIGFDLDSLEFYENWLGENIGRY